MKEKMKGSVFKEPGIKHVDAFVDDMNTDEYASWFFMLKRLPAILQLKFRDRLASLKLFCTYREERWRVTGASRMGDVWLAKDFGREIGYDVRVAIDDCSNWSPEP